MKKTKKTSQYEQRSKLKISYTPKKRKLINYDGKDVTKHVVKKS